MSRAGRRYGVAGQASPADRSEDVIIISDDEDVADDARWNSVDGGRVRETPGSSMRARRRRVSEEARRRSMPYAANRSAAGRRRAAPQEPRYDVSDDVDMVVISSSQSSDDDGGGVGDDNPASDRSRRVNRFGAHTETHESAGFWSYVRSAFSTNASRPRERAPSSPAHPVSGRSTLRREHGMGGNEGGPDVAASEAAERRRVRRASSASRHDRPPVQDARRGPARRRGYGPMRATVDREAGYLDDDDDVIFVAELGGPSRPAAANESVGRGAETPTTTSSYSTSSSRQDYDDGGEDDDEDDLSDPDERYDDAWAARVGRAYRAPRAMHDEEDDASVSAAAYKYPAPQDEPARMLPVLEGTMLLADLLERLPWTNMLRGIRDAEADGEDRLLTTHTTFFGRLAPWDSHDGFMDYPSGDMFFARPSVPYGVYVRTLRQAYASVHLLTTNSLEESLSQSKITHVTAVEFLLDAAVRVAANCHAAAKEFKRARETATGPGDGGPGADISELTLLSPVGDRAAPLLARLGRVKPASGPVASVLRSSYGSLIAWPALREAIDSPGRRHARYVFLKILEAEVVLTARASPARVGLSRSERDILARCLTMGSVAAERALQFLYAAIGRRLHPRLKDAEYAAVAAQRPTLFLPMGSETVRNVESDVMSSLEENVTGGTIAIGSVSVMTYYSVRSSMTELMSEFAESHASGNSENVASVLVAFAAVLQRFLGYLNRLVCVLTRASVYGGKRIIISSDTLARYASVVDIALPLYAPRTMDDFWKEQESALYDLALTPRENEHPPSGENAVRSVPPDADLTEFPPRGTDAGPPSVLGEPVDFGEAMSTARWVVLGQSVVRTSRDQVTGRRAIGGTRRC